MLHSQSKKIKADIQRIILKYDSISRSVKNDISRSHRQLKRFWIYLIFDVFLQNTWRYPRWKKLKSWRSVMISLLDYLIERKFVDDQWTWEGTISDVRYSWLYWRLKNMIRSIIHFCQILFFSDSDVPLAICASSILLGKSDTFGLSVGCPPAPSSADDEERVKIMNILSE